MMTEMLLAWPLEKILLPVVLALAGLAVYVRLYVYLHFFQQEEYHPWRFVGWWFGHAAFDRKLTLGAGVGLLVAWLWPVASVLALLPLVLGALWVVLTTPDPRRHAKKKLVMTPRATRIAAIAALLLLGGFAAAKYFGQPLWGAIATMQLLPLALLLANALWWPYERWNQWRYYAEAKQVLARVAPITIGITGSFGKTSVKHILGHLLAAAGPTAWAAGSINTPMGLTRFVRERLLPSHKFFIAEMGAYLPGSVARLCKMFPPATGIVTSLGHEHFERFKSMERIVATHCELIDAVLAQGGRLVVHDQLLEFAPIKARYDAAPQKFLWVGQAAAAQLRYTAAGQELSFVWQRPDGQEERASGTLSLLGRHQQLNAALALGQALLLGMTLERAVAQLRTVPQIKHRLELKPQPDGSVVLDDAFNANPAGLAEALTVTRQLASAQGGRAVVITPGMVELGERHDSEHAAIGKLAASLPLDWLAVVVPERVPTLLEAYKAAGGNLAALKTFASFAEASHWLRALQQPKDVVLLANDLPDLYEAKLSW